MWTPNSRRCSSPSPSRSSANEAAAGALALEAADPGLEQIKEDREAAFVEGFKRLLPPGLLGLMLTGMLAALASTVDTHLNWGSSYWTNDIYKRFLSKRLFNREPGERELVWIARGLERPDPA